MNPFEHGEVFVTDDGGETDLDLGHYERFIDESLTRDSNATTGSIYSAVLAAERRGRLPRQDRAGHPAHHRRDQAPHHPPGRRRRRRRDHRGRRHGRRHRDPPVPRGHPAVPPRRRPRQRLLRPRDPGAVHRTVGRAEDQAHPALGHRAALAGASSPTPSSCRSDEPLAEGLKRKISNLCDVPVDAVVNAADAGNLYEIPLVLHEEGLDDVVCQILRLDGTDPDLTEWEILVDRVEPATERSVRIGIIGKYVSLQRRLPVGGRGAQARRLPPRRQGRDRVDPGRGRRGPAGRGPARTTSTAS